MGDGPADRHRGLVPVGAARPVGDVDGGLGRPVEVVQFGGVRAGAVHLVEVPHGGDGQGLAAGEDVPQGGAGGGPRVAQEHAEDGRHEVGDRHRLLAQQPRQVGGVGVAAGPGHDDRGAREERPEELPHRDVEAVRRLLRDPVGRAEGEAFLHPQQPVGHALLGVAAALGLPGGAGGVDRVGRVVGAEGHGRRGRRVGGERLPVLGAAGADHDGARLGGDGGAGLVGDDDPGAAVLEQVADALGRVGGIDRDVDGAGAHDADERGDEVGGAVHVHGDVVPGRTPRARRWRASRAVRSASSR